MAFGLEEFKKSQLGRQVGAIIEDPQIVGDMLSLSRHGIPAIQAVGKALLNSGSDIRDVQVKKTIGRWVREILEGHGWTVWRKGRVTPGNLFSTGMIYRPSRQSHGESNPSSSQPQPLSPAERAAGWRASVRGLPHTEPLSDEAISRESVYGDRS